MPGQPTAPIDTPVRPARRSRHHPHCRYCSERSSRRSPEVPWKVFKKITRWPPSRRGPLVREPVAHHLGGRDSRFRAPVLLGTPGVRALGSVAGHVVAVRSRPRAAATAPTSVVADVDSAGRPAPRRYAVDSHIYLSRVRRVNYCRRFRRARWQRSGQSGSADSSGNQSTHSPAAARARPSATVGASASIPARVRMACLPHP